MKPIYQTLIGCVATAFIAGCFAGSGGGCSPRKKLPQREADHIVFTLLASELNRKQTNWTVLIIERTNSPVKTD